MSILSASVADELSTLPILPVAQNRYSGRVAALVETTAAYRDTATTGHCDLAESCAWSCPLLTRTGKAWPDVSADWQVDHPALAWRAALLLIHFLQVTTPTPSFVTTVGLLLDIVLSTANVSLKESLESYPCFSRDLTKFHLLWPAKDTESHHGRSKEEGPPVLPGDCMYGRVHGSWTMDVGLTGLPPTKQLIK